MSEYRSKPKLATYNAFKGCHPNQQVDINRLAGSTLSLLSLITMHYFSETVFTTTSLAKKIENIQGKFAVRRPTPAAFLPVFQRLDSELVSVDEAPYGKTRSCTEAQITPAGQSRGVGYAAIVLGLCLDNRGLTPRSVMGMGGDPMESGPQLPANRFGLYRLLGTTEEQFFSPEIAQALRLKNAARANQLVKGLEDSGVVVRNKTEQRDRQGNVLHGIQFSNMYRDAFGGFVDDIRLLSTDDGVEAGQKRAEAIVGNPEDFAYLTTLATTSH